MVSTTTQLESEKASLSSMSELLARGENLLTIAQAAEAVPVGPGMPKPNKRRVYTWIYTGVRNEKLESCLVGGKLFTSLQALERFFARINAPRRASHQDSGATETVDRKRMIDRAEKECSAAGL